MGRLVLYLIEVVIIFLFVKMLGRVLQFFLGAPRTHFWTNLRAPHEENTPPTQRGEMVRDPICGMFVSTELSHRLSLGSETLHFCSRECLERYQKDDVHAPA